MLPKDFVALKVTCASTVLAFLGLLTVSYVRLSSIARQSIVSLTTTTLNRDLELGRVVRCNPFTGVRIKNVALRKSRLHPTAPVVSARYVDVNFSGLFAAIVLRRPLELNVRLDHATVRVSQTVVTGLKGQPVGQWDPGVYFEDFNSMDATNAKKGVQRLLQYVQPGRLSFRNAHVLLQPADFQDYGHGSQVVEVENVSADVVFPRISLSESSDTPFGMKGVLRAEGRGLPLGGGSIGVECEVDGNTILSLQPEDVAVKLHVEGEGVRADSIASFLSLPFRADEGRCGGDVDMEFLYKSSSLVPLMRGEAQLDSVALRFHPDPKTPEFRHINGKLRFEGKRLFLDGPVGDLGEIPMTVVGNIHLEDGYELMGYSRPIDINNVITTFDIDNFVPVEGQVKGEIQMSGILEEPIISGWAETVNDRSVFDRLPLQDAGVTFEWDSIAGLLRFNEIRASVKGGGIVTGEGSLFFDMTKDSPFGMSRAEHSLRSPKAIHWNRDVDPNKVPPLLPLPSDELEIDEHAQFRPYDSMRFDFSFTEVNGSDLLKYYGGEYGAMARMSLGLVSGEAILAGHAKDANCRAMWRSVTPPPKVPLRRRDPMSDVSKPLDVKSVPTNGADQASLPDMNSPAIVRAKVPSETKVPPEMESTSFPIEDNEGGSGLLGGGEFRGLVYLKLGDLPEARRVKVRTAVKNFDARRAGWCDPALRNVFSQSPLLNTSMDTYFKGVMFQRALLSPGQTKVPRNPRMELLGVDGALAVKRLTVNNCRFDNIMNGSFSFSSSDFAMSLKEYIPEHAVKKDSSRGNAYKKGEAALEKESRKGEKDELSVAGSLKGVGNISLRRDGAFFTASVVKDQNGNQIATLLSQDVNVQDFLGEDYSFSGGEAISGVINARMRLNLTKRSGRGSILVRNPGVGHLKLSSVAGKILWQDNNIFLEKGRVRYRRSEYRIDARYNSKSNPESSFGWEVNVDVPQTSLGDIADLIQSGNSVATAMQSPDDKQDSGRFKYAAGPLWIQRLSHATDKKSSRVTERWALPQGLSPAEEMEWYLQLKEEQKRLDKQSSRTNHEVSSRDISPAFSRIRGDLSGQITIRYDSKSGENGQVPTTANAVLQAILDQLTRTTFTFRLSGKDWALGDFPVQRVLACGTFEDGILDVGPFLFDGQQGFGANMKWRISSAGSVEGSAVLRKAPAALVNQYSGAPVDVDGECNGRFEVQGTIANPSAFGRMVWTDATLNGKQVRGAKTDMACVNGRCILNVDARIGGRRRSRESSETDILQSLNWTEGVVQSLKDLGSRASNRNEALPVKDSKLSKKEVGEALQVHASAPVRFYLLRYLQSRARGSFWSALEPAIGGSYPLDDEWILVEADIKKYGSILLNRVVPELGWEGGDSDVNLRVSGTLPRPIIKGNVSVSDGRLWPKALSEPLLALRGELQFHENGLITLKSFSGRCSGKNLSLYGDMFISESSRAELEEKICKDQEALSRLKPRNASQKRERRMLLIHVNEAKSAMQRARRGLTLDFRDIPINIENNVISGLSGKVEVTGVAMKPLVSGGVTFSDGVVLLGGGGAGLRGAPDVGNGKLRFSESSLLGEGVASARESTSIGDRSVEKGQADGDGGESNGGRKGTGVFLRDFEVSMGKGMKVIQPFVLNVDASGKVTLDGESSDPAISGEIGMLGGNINMLTSRMSLRKEEASYVRFPKQEGRVQNKVARQEPLIKIALEDQNLILRVSECGLSSWADHITLTDKSGEGLSEEWWSRVMLPGLEGSGPVEMVKRIVRNVVITAFGVGRRVGKVEWKVFPSVFHSSSTWSEANLQDEIGAGAQVDLGGLTVTGRKALSGKVGGGLSMRLWKWLRLQVDSDGDNHGFGVEWKLQQSAAAREGDSAGDTDSTADSIRGPVDAADGEEGLDGEAKRMSRNERSTRANGGHGGEGN